MSGYGEKPGKRLRSEERAATILAAAAEVFAAQGYDRASMREIARSAGVTTPVLYDHFDNKIGLYASTVERQAGLLVSQWMTDPAPVTPKDVFNSTTRAFFLAVSRSEQTWRLLFADRPKAPEAMEVQQQVQSYATEAIVAALHQLPELHNPLGIDDERAYYALAEAIKGAGHALVNWWQHNKDIPIELITSLNELLLWRGLASMFGDGSAAESECIEVSGDEKNGEIM